MGKYLRISSYTLLGSPSSYMTLQLLHSEFPYIRGKSFLTVQRGGVATRCRLFGLILKHHLIVSDILERKRQNADGIGAKTNLMM
jgi:hypothetical protein